MLLVHLRPTFRRENRTTVTFENTDLTAPGAVSLMNGRSLLLAYDNQSIASYNAQLRLTLNF